MAKKEKVFKPLNFIIFWGVIAAVILAFVIVFNCVAVVVFHDLFTRVFGSSGSSQTDVGADVDLEYFKSDYESDTDLRAYQEDLCEQIGDEGIVLLENDSMLPLEAEQTTLHLFGQTSVRFVYGGTGSGTNSTESNINLRQGLENAGFTVNSALWDFYSTGGGSEYVRGEGAIMYGGAEDWSINECPINVITSDSSAAASIASPSENDVAVYVLGRTGGEGRDLARGMSQYADSNEDKARHYLEPDSTELGVINYLNEHFENVILLVNTNNAMELGWVSDYANIGAVLYVPGTGLTGNNAIGSILAGDVSPSGGLVDTYVYDNFSSPAMMSMGDFAYVNNGREVGNYVTYYEGIYVGYRYYETRYEDYVLDQGDADGAATDAWNYDDEVLYPFGYGLSYATFTYSDLEVTENDDSFTVSLNVTNDTDVPSKEVVQIYMQKPYTSGEVEKSAVDLVGYAKVEVGAEETVAVTVTVDKEQMKSYDSTLVNDDGTNGGYVVDAGTYNLTAASDAHEAVNNILMAKGATAEQQSRMSGAGNASLVGSYEQAARDTTTYHTENDTDVTNQFDHGTNDSITYLSRADWVETYPEIDGTVSNRVSSYGERNNGTDTSGAPVGYQYEKQISDEDLAKLNSTDSLNPVSDSSITTDYTFSEGNGVEFIDLRGKSFDDPLWEDLFDNMSASEFDRTIARCGYQTPSVTSINKPQSVDLDGPAGLNAVVGHASVAMSYPCEVLIAQTWNEQLAYEMGVSVGEDGLMSDTEGWYAPAMNIHRTPFAGRNFEYYSEDSYLSGVMGSAAVSGAASKGMYSFIKHYALNDQEDHRNGLVTWSNEQAIREIYLKPFEMCVKSGTQTIFYYELETDEDGNTTYTRSETEVPVCTAIMSSFNRIGYTWAGGNWHLLTQVTRNEWGFNGFILTDYDNGGYMDTEQMLRAGGDAKLSQYGSYNASDDSPADTYYARQAAKHIFYAVVNSAAVNGFIHGVEEIPGFSYYILILIALDVVAAAGLAVIGVRMFLKLKKYYKNKQAGPQTDV